MKDGVDLGGRWDWKSVTWAMASTAGLQQTGPAGARAADRETVSMEGLSRNSKDRCGAEETSREGENMGVSATV